MKKWPKGNKQAQFTDITKPICEAIRFAYDLKRKNRGRNVPWDGLDIGENMKACYMSPNERLQRDNLKYDEQEQDRDALQIIVGIAVQLGIEQERRRLWGELDTDLLLLNLHAKNCYETVKGLIEDSEVSKN
jgi:hypothetical protein